MTQRNNDLGTIQEDPHPPISPTGGVAISISDPPHKVFPSQIAKEKILEGIRMEREKVVRLLMSPSYRHLPSEDAAMVIHNGIHWGDFDAGR